MSTLLDLTKTAPGRKVDRVKIDDVFNSFQTQAQAVEYLERVRWHGKPVCPYCGGGAVYRHTSPDRASSRLQCYKCHRAFAVTVGTIFHGTHIPLRDWFLCVALVLNATKSANAYQIARDLGMRRATVWTMMQRIRSAIANDPDQARMLYGIVGADDTCVGVPPRHAINDDSPPRTRERDTSSAPASGLVERGGRVIARRAKLGQLSSEVSSI